MIKKIVGDANSHLYHAFAHRLRPHNVCMFHLGRCGSTVLADMLDQIPGITWGHEVLQGAFRGVDPSEVPVPGGRAKARSIIWNKMGRKGHTKIFGGEIKPYHLDCFGWKVDQCIRDLCELGFDRFIVLERENSLRKIVSSCYARKRGFYHIRTGSENRRNDDIDQVYINVSEVGIGKFPMSLIEHIQYCERFYQGLSELLDQDNTLQLRYERDIQRDPNVAFRKVVEFLGVNPASQIDIRLKRTTVKPLSEVIQNYEEVASALENTPHRWMLGA